MHESVDCPVDSGTLGLEGAVAKVEVAVVAGDCGYQKTQENRKCSDAYLAGTGGGDGGTGGVGGKGGGGLGGLGGGDLSAKNHDEAELGRWKNTNKFTTREWLRSRVGRYLTVGKVEVQVASVAGTW
ncbi:hypothetical protein BSKO_13506 [Bryopsis sp. KO-2023]|nr:hypothetical protein BSKO_13506 [Bryopsis sp. KO-2023]